MPGREQQHRQNIGLFHITPRFEFLLEAVETWPVDDAKVERLFQRLTRIVESDRIVGRQELRQQSSVFLIFED